MTDVVTIGENGDHANKVEQADEHEQSDTVVDVCMSLINEDATSEDVDDHGREAEGREDQLDPPDPHEQLVVELDIFFTHRVLSI